MQTTALKTQPAQELVSFTIQPITYAVTKAEIEKVVSAALMLRVNDVNDKAGLERCQKEQSNLTRMTSTIEKQRQAMKRESIDYGRQVDTVAKELSGPLEKAKAHLQEQRSIVQREQERVAKERQDNRDAVVRGRLAELAECGCIVSWADVLAMTDAKYGDVLENARADKKARDDEAAAAAAEQYRINEENRIESARIAKERAEMERERAEAETRSKRGIARLESLAQLGHAHTMTVDQLADAAPNHWEEVISNARLIKQRSDDADAKVRAALETQRQEQAAAQAKIDAEKRQLRDELCQKRLDTVMEIGIPFGHLINATTCGDGKTVGDMPQSQFDEIVVELRAEKAELEAELAKELAAEQERKAADEQAKAAAAEAELKRLEALRPDHEKLLAVAAWLQSYKFPTFSTIQGIGAAQRVDELIDECAISIRELANELVGESAA